MNAVLRRVSRQQKARPVAFPSCVGGWNTRDALAAMPPLDAVILDNWFPGLSSCKMRGGSSGYATTLGGTVKTLAEFNAGGNRKFLAAANGKWWDISIAGAGVQKATGFTQDAWEWAQFDDSAGGARIGFVNGADAPQICDGTLTFSAMTLSGGITAANMNLIHIYKGRSYLADDRTQDFWYSATGALGGAMTKFPLGRVQGTGGNIQAFATWSRDAGDGMDDMIVFILSSGDVLVYSGSNPGDATDFQLAGRYNISPLIGKRAITKFGADLILGTKAGYISLNRVFAAGRANEQSASISSKIRQSVLDAVAVAGSTFGWQLVHYPVGNQLFMNVPTSSAAVNQHVMNTETRAWCRFLGMNAQCWGLFNDRIYFGTTAGTVLLADTGSGDSGAGVTANAQTAWNYIGAPNDAKRISALRVGLRRPAQTIAYLCGIGFDFRELLTCINQTLSGSAGATWESWETNPWDTQPWGGDDTASNEWSSAFGEGFAVSVSLQISSATQRAEWYAMTYLAERGGPV